MSVIDCEPPYVSGIRLVETLKCLLIVSKQ